MRASKPIRDFAGPARPLVSIIIVTYNSEDEIRDCLQSILDSSVRESWELVVVDNASRDRSAEIVRNEFPQLKLIANTVNVGFAAANNQALPFIAGDLVLLVNPDSRLCDGAIDAAVKHMKRYPECGILGGLLLDEEGGIHPSARRFPNALRKILMLSGVRERWKSSFFGSDPETLAKLQVRLPELYPGLRIAGAIAPPYGRIEEWDNEAYIEEIRQAEPHLFLGALGFPKQAIWINRYLKPAVPVLAIGVGASLDFLEGKQVRAPLWMQRCGMEWFWRMAGDPGRLVKRYAGDFLSLARLLARELPLFCKPARTARFAPVANGIQGAMESIVVRDGCDWAELRMEVAQSKRKVVVMDCGELHRPSLRICSELVSLARAATRTNKTAALYGGGSRICAYLKKIGVEEGLPVFEHPLALEAWVRKQTSIFAGRTWTLNVPGNLTESRIKEFRGCVREIVQRMRAEGEVLRLCLDEVNRASLVAMLQLTRWCEQFEGRHGVITLSGGTDQLQEAFRIVGLEDYLEAAPLPLDGHGRGPEKRETSRASAPEVPVAEEDELVLGEETLWD